MGELESLQADGPLRGVLVGCGHVSKFHLTAWQQLEGCEIVAVADRVSARAARAAGDFGIDRPYTDFEAMLRAEQPDFVDIATRPDSHLALVETSAAAGAAVLCQKPIAGSLAELSSMISSCERHGVVFAVNENFRFQPWFRHLKALLEEGAVGRVHHVDMTTRARLTLPDPDFSGQPYFAEMPRLLIYEFGIHLLDTARYLHGEASTVYARIQKASEHIAGEDVATIVLSIGDATVVLDLSWASGPPPSQDSQPGWLHLRIEGSTGTLELTPDWQIELASDSDHQSWQFSGDGQSGYTAMQRHFVESLQSGSSPETRGAEIQRTMELVFGAYHAAAHQRVYRVGTDLGLLH